MTLYAGLDVGEKATHLCVVDGEGSILWRGACATDPEALAFTPRRRAPGLVRVDAGDRRALGITVPVHSIPRPDRRRAPAAPRSELG